MLSESATDVRESAGLAEPIFPARTQTATQSFGRGGDLIVIPDTQPSLLEKVEAFGFRPEDVRSLLEAGAVLAGSFLLHHLIPGAQWSPGDLDVFGPARALEVAKFRLGKPDDESAEKSAEKARYAHVAAAEHVQTIQEVATWTSAEGTKLQFICVACPPEEAVRQFDLPLVQSCGNTSSDMTVVVRRLERARKYAARGFAIQLPATIVASSVEQWDAMVKACDPDLRSVISSVYAVPDTARAAWCEYAVSLSAHAYNLKRTWRSDASCRSLREFAAAHPFADVRPSCTVVRRADREWLKRADVDCGHLGKTI